MSNEKTPESEAEDNGEEPSSRFNLPLAYGLLGAAIVAAVCIAIFIVLPFYHRH